MWGRLRSALFVDFENIGPRVSPAALQAMTAWLEDGKFDEASRRRRLVSKRVYWNSSAEKHRDTFEAAGFEVVLCEKFSAMKNGADIRMALDVLDSFATRTLRAIAYMTKLRGAETVIVGIQPDVAFAMVQLGLTLEDVLTALDLEEGLRLLDQRLEERHGSQ